MNIDYSQETVGKLVAARPSRSRIFEELGIDYCCGGKITLETACAQLSLDPTRVVQSLLSEEAGRTDSSETWDNRPASELIPHIVSTHHAYLNQNLPRLSELTTKVLNAHGSRHPELAQLKETVEVLRAELEAHLLKEEQVLFPFILQLEEAVNSGARKPAHNCGSVGNPVRVMEWEHDQAGVALRTIRLLTKDFTAPEGACNTYRAMLDALLELETDMHQHIHKENSILFPKAIELEAKLAG